MATENELHLLSHHPRDLNEDKLGYCDYAEAIQNIFINLSVNNTGLTVGVFGNWGSGKSTILKMVKKVLLRQPKKFLIVQFDAWRYGKQEDIWISLLRRILAEIEDQAGYKELLRVNWNLWEARLSTSTTFWREIIRIVIRFVFIVFFFIALSNLLFDIDSSSKIEWLVALGGTGVFIFLDLITLAWRSSKTIHNQLESHLSRLSRPSSDANHSILIDNFRDDFKIVVNSIGQSYPIIVLIDDLDRAPLDQIVPVLEAIKHFGLEPSEGQELAPIAFLLAADRRALEYAIASHYDKFWSQLVGVEKEQHAREYLEKIVQIVFELPPLSLLQLEGLFDEQQATGEAKTIRGARREARKVFAQGLRQQPREAIEAYNTFQSIWQVVQKRNLDSTTSPPLLAILILIRYSWPKVFTQFTNYPELFFDLYAVASGNSNVVCSRTEIEEIRSSGCPVENNSALVEQLRHDQPDILKLLATINLPENLDWNRLYEIFVLVQGQSAPQGQHLIEVGRALMSGDPSLIKFAKRAHGSQVKQEKVPWLLEFLLDKTIKENEGQGDEVSNNKMVKAIFALGRIGDDRAIEPLIQIIENRTNHTNEIVTRTLFALAHLSELEQTEESEQQKTSEVVADLLVDKSVAIALHMRALRLFGPVLLAHSRIRHAILCLALHSQMKLVREVALEYASQGVERDDEGIWLTEALEILNQAC